MPLKAYITRYPALEWITPFAVFMLLLATAPILAIPQPWESVFRVGVLSLVLVAFSGRLLRELRVKHLLASTVLGLAVCLLWIAPDYLLPGWREHWLFQNPVTGTLQTSIPAAELTNPLVVTLRITRAVLLVPILEELFWRGWLPRWVVANDWQKVPLGTYTAMAFVVTAVLFAAEHGPYWDVGLLCGLIYNWWMWKTRSLGDLILAHAVTNAALSGFVVVTEEYQYWM